MNLRALISKLTTIKKVDPNADSAKLQREHIERMVGNYKATFEGHAGEEVLQDLAYVCGFLLPAPADEKAMARYEGQRDVFLHILGYLEMDLSQLRSQSEQPEEGGYTTQFKI